MRKSLYQTLIHDLGIQKYEGETENQVICRTLYAAVARWIRYFVLDENDSMKAHPKSKRYILKRLRETVERLINVFPEVEQWFRSEGDLWDYSEFYKVIRDDMIRTQELYDVDGRIMLPSYKLRSYPCGLCRIIGISENEVYETKAAGISRIAIFLESSIEPMEMQQLFVESKKFTEWIYHSAKWTKHMNTEGLEFFNPYSRRALYQSWDNAPVISFRWALGRISIVNGLFEYYLMKQMDGVWYSTKLAEIFFENKDYRRIMLGLRSMVNNQISAIAEYRKNAVILHFYCKLPVLETTLIKTFCWPLESFSDDRNYVVPIEVWPFIKELCRNLCITLEENLHE